MCELNVGSLPYTYRLTGCIVNIHHEMADVSFDPFLVKYLRSGEMIYMLYSVYSLARSYTVCVIGIGIRAVRHEPSALPCKGAAVPCPGVTHVVICYALTVERSKQIAPAAGSVTVCYRILYRTDVVMPCPSPRRADGTAGGMKVRVL